MKTVKFYTLGCKVNQYETQAMREGFLRKGFKELENGRKADAYVINTCTVTHKADRDSLYYIHHSHKENPKAKIIVTGCLAQLDGNLLKRQKGVSLIVKNRDKYVIPDMLLKGNRAIKEEKRGHNPGVSGFKNHSRAFLKIQDGCNNLCSYCKVALVRGRSTSKPLEKITAEAKQLVENGFKEIVLTGICLGAYGKDFFPRRSLAEALGALERIEGLKRIRLSSIEPQDVTGDLIAKIKVSKKVCPHVHIPLQSGDDQILKSMRRRYRAKDFIALIQRLKKEIPGVAITTDCLVGFPGESDVQFQNTLRIIKEIIPLKVHIFPYSLREGTLASALENQIQPKIAKERIKLFGKISEARSLKFKRQFLGKNMEVLVEGRVKDGKGRWEGHTGNYLKVRFLAGGNIKNKLVTIRLKKIEGDYILGSRADIESQ